MSHVLVHWEDENTYSSVQLKRVDVGNDRGEKIVGKTYRINWNKQYHTGRILGVGTSGEVLQMEIDYAQAAADLSFTGSEVEDGDLLDTNHAQQHTTRTITATISNSSPEGSEIPLNVEDTDRDENNGQHLNADDQRQAGFDVIELDALTQKENLIAKMHSEMEQLKKQNQKSKRVIRKRGLDTLEIEESMVQIAAGIEIKKSIVDFTKLLYSSRPSLFIRKLIFEGGVFTLQDVANSSMTGKSSPMFPNLKRPPLDPVRLQALKEFTKECCGIVDKSPACITLEQTLKNLPGDARKKLKSSRQNVSGNSS